MKTNASVKITNKEKIINLLKENGPLTQFQLAKFIYGDNKHIANIYSTLMFLVESGMVYLHGPNPSYYSVTLMDKSLLDQNHVRKNISLKEPVSEGKVILLNKIFLGGWLDKQGNIGHEIIDFLQTDNGEYFVYNNPWGVCPDNIWVEGTTTIERNEKEKYTAKYLVLTSEKRSDEFNILYVIELKEKLHRYHKSRDTIKNSQDELRNYIRSRMITYNNKFLDDIYGIDDSLFITFEGKNIYKATVPINIKGISYNFQRNKGYLYSDKNTEDYFYLEELISSSINNGNLDSFTPRKVNLDQIGKHFEKKTFLDLIHLKDDEQVFTNILHSILEHGDLLKRFCNKFNNGKRFDQLGTFFVTRETKIADGRMDVCAESQKQRVIIENKIYSGLNGLKPEDNITQLTTYYLWGKEKEIDPLCFILVPNFRLKEIEREIVELDPNMLEIYTIITYGEIADFIFDEMRHNLSMKEYKYFRLIHDIYAAFKNLSFLTREDFYASMFLQATNTD